jgi:Copper type II ascorbate-dependent monooxygenase, C-terminal domain
MNTGEEPQALPENIGIPLFDPNGNFRSIVVEIHYNNPELLEGLVDSSGFRIYYSAQPREIEAAWLSVGDPVTLMNGQPIEDGLTEYTFTCGGDCSSTVLGSESVTVLAESLHMHKSGVRMTNELIRDGEVANMGAVDVFEFDQQGSFRVQQEPYEIMSGDAFRTTCYYRDGTAFGLGSQEEMCVAFLLYYPAKKLDFGAFGSFPWSCIYGIDSLPVCKEEMEFQTLGDEADLGRGFGTSPTQCMDMQTDVEQETPSSDTGTSPTGSDEQTDAASKISFVALSILMIAAALA